MLVSHYTSFESAHSILKSERIWLSEAETLNDGAETRELDRIAEEYLESLGEQFLPCAKLAAKSNVMPIQAWVSEVFIGSFCQNIDDLSMYRSYCPNGGCCLVFDVPNGNLAKCIYSRDEKLALLKDNMHVESAQIYHEMYGCTREECFAPEPIGSNDVLPELEHLLLLFKNHTFAHENEWRWFGARDEDELETFEFRFHADIESFTIFNGKHYAVSRWPGMIKSVIIWPKQEFFMRCSMFSKWCGIVKATESTFVVRR